MYIKKIRALAYYKIDPIILQFIYTITYYYRITLVCFIYTKALKYIEYTYYYNKCIYEHIFLRAISVILIQKVIIKMSIRFYQMRK